MPPGTPIRMMLRGGWMRSPELVRDADHLAAARRKARERAKLFSWQRVAETYLTLMARVDGSEDVIDDATRSLLTGE